MAEFSFGQVEAVLASINTIADHKRTAFTGRLKTLQKNGVLRRENPGRGKAGSYSFSHLVQLAFGLELMKSGLAPNRAARIVAHSWTDISISAYLSTFTEVEAANLADETGMEAEITNWAWLVHVDALAELTVGGASEFDDYEAVEAIEMSRLGEWVDMLGMTQQSQGRFMLVVNATALIRSIVWKVGYDFKFSSVEKMREDIQADHDALVDLLNSIDIPGLPDGEGQRAPKGKIPKSDLRNLMGVKFTNHSGEHQQKLIQHAKQVLEDLSPNGKVVLAEMAAHGRMVIKSDANRDGIKEMIDAELFELINYPDESQPDSEPNDEEASDAPIHLELNNLGATVLEIVKRNQGAS